MELEARLRQFATLNAIGEILNREGDFAVAVPRALERLVELLGVRAGWVFLSNTSRGDPHQGSFTLATACGLPPALATGDCLPLRQGGCECQGRLRRGELERGVNIVKCSRLATAIGDRGGLEIHASVPLLGPEGPVGILNLAAPGDARFDEETLAFLANIGRQLGSAFTRSRLQAERAAAERYTAVLEERQRLARELHDSLAQLLFAAELSLQIAATGGDARERAEAFRGATANLRAAQEELRGLVEVMRPVDLAEGLLPALTRLAERAGGAGMAMHLDAQPVTVTGKSAEALYRIAQEAVHNALRHSGGANVWLRLSRDDGALTLAVADDGRGPPEAPGATGLGLEGMRERALALGGTLDTGKRPGGGFLVRAEVPWPTG